MQSNVLRANGRDDRWIAEAPGRMTLIRTDKYIAERGCAFPVPVGVVALRIQHRHRGAVSLTIELRTAPAALLRQHRV